MFATPTCAHPRWVLADFSTLLHKQGMGLGRMALRSCFNMGTPNLPKVAGSNIWPTALQNQFLLAQPVPKPT